MNMYNMTMMPRFQSLPWFTSFCARALMHEIMLEATDNKLLASFTLYSWHCKSKSMWMAGCNQLVMRVLLCTGEGDTISLKEACCRLNIKPVAIIIRIQKIVDIFCVTNNT